MKVEGKNIMFNFTDYTVAYIIGGITFLLLIVMAIIYRRISNKQKKNILILVSVLIFICGGYSTFVCKTKTDTMLQEIDAFNKKLDAKPSYLESSCIQYKNYPPIYVHSDAKITESDVQLVKEELDITPEWLYKDISKISFVSLQYLEENFSITQPVSGYALNEYGVYKIYLTSLASSKTLNHELGHVYDYKFFITYTQDYHDIEPPTVLSTNQAKVCEAIAQSNGNADYCMSSYHETFADAIALYVMSPDKLPPDLKAWMDSLPK